VGFGEIGSLIRWEEDFMTLERRAFLGALGAGAVTPAWGRQDQPSPERWTDAQVEQYLAKAKVMSSKELSTGITNSLRLSLSLDGVTHDAHFQSIDESKPRFEGQTGTEMNFRDTWKYNVAAYRLDRLLGLKMTPASIERNYGGKTGAFTWWIVNSTMETDRIKKHLNPPDQEEWNKQMYIVRVFDQLIFNTDRNLQNLLMTPDWRLWMIDHTRAFRLYKTLKTPGDLVRCERHLFARLQTLSLDEVKKSTSPYLNPGELAGLMGRRDRIIELFNKKIKAEGESAVLYDYVRA
jgi:hypothetical protein